MCTIDFRKTKRVLNTIVSIKKTLMEMTMGCFIRSCHTVTPPSSGPHYLSMHMRGHRHTWRHTMRMGWGEASARGGINPQVSHRREKQAGMNVRKRQIYFLSVSRQHKQAVLRTPSCVETEAEVFSPKIAVGTKGSAHGRETCRGLQRREKRFSPHWSRSSQYCISQEG